MQIREIKFSRFVSRKLIQVGKKWSNKQFEILNRSFIQQIVWNFTNPLVLTFLGFLLIYRFQTRGTGSDPKIQIRKHSWRKRKSELGEKCSKQTGSSSFVVDCPQLRSLCPLGAIAYVWLRAERIFFLQSLLQEFNAILLEFTKQRHVGYAACNFETPSTYTIAPPCSADDDDDHILQRHLSSGQPLCRVPHIVWEHLVTTTGGQRFVMTMMRIAIFMMMLMMTMMKPIWMLISLIL